MTGASYTDSGGHEATEALFKLHCKCGAGARILLPVWLLSKNYADIMRTDLSEVQPSISLKVEFTNIMWYAV